MSQHFLLSRAARDKNLSPRKVLAFSDQEARDLFAKLRWGCTDKQTCPHCGVVEDHRYVAQQKRWRCRRCYKAFSVTTGTVFAHHKLSLQVILYATITYANAAKGMSALQLSRDVDVQYKTAFVLLHKLRETLWLTQDASMLAGEVEIDGGYVYNYVRPENKKTDRKDLRLAENQNKAKCVVLVMRQRSGTKKIGANRTKVAVIHSEEKDDVMPVVQKSVTPGATVYTDECKGYTWLGAYYQHEVVNHSASFQSPTGVNENQAESYVARFRRMMMGQIHHAWPKYLEVYANEMAFREDFRRRSNGEFLCTVIAKCLHSRPSREWTKYWQRRKPARTPAFRDEDFPM